MSVAGPVERLELLVAASCDQSLTPAAKTVLAQILWHYNGRTGLCSPSLDRLARTSRLARRSVVRAVKELRETGWIEREHANRSDGRSFLTNHFKPVFARSLDLEGVGTTRSPGRDETVPRGGDETVPRVGTKRGVEVGTGWSPKHSKKNTGKGTQSESFDSASFERFWQVYPRKVAKDAARRAFERIIREGKATPDEVIAGATRFAAERAGEDPKFTAHAATWLNAGRWADEPAPRHVSNSNGRQTYSAIEAFRRNFGHDD